jgi:hypothetical protein
MDRGPEAAIVQRPVTPVNPAIPSVMLGGVFRFMPLVLILLAGCRGSSTSAGPTPVPAGAAPVTSAVQLSGRVVATVTGEPLAGISVDLEGQRTTTDPGGVFALGWDANQNPVFGRATLAGPTILSRGLTIGTSTSREITVDAIVLGNGFDLDYYRKLVRDTSDAPGVLRTLRRWTRAPRVYLKAVDEAGIPIDEVTLSVVESALRDDGAAWTGGRFGVADVQRGSGTREGQSGWLTVRWPNPATEGNNCGRAQVGVDGGWIELNYLNRACGCGGSRAGAGLVRHELGHALGFFHTGDVNDLMKANLDPGTLCNGRASARERYHAAIAYSRPVGNTDPDVDPATTIQSRGLEPVVVVD